MFFVHDVGGRILDVNQRSCTDLGYSRAELLNLTVDDVSCGYTPALRAEQWASALPGTAITVREIAVRKDRTTFPVEISVSCQMIDGCKLFLGLARDVGPREAAQRALEELNSHLERRVRRRTREIREERERLVLATRAGGMGVWDYDLACDQLFCDEQWYRIMGRNPNEPIRSLAQFRKLIHPDDVEHATAVDLPALITLVANHQDYQVAFRIIRPGGEIRWVRSIASLIEAEDGLPARAVGFVMDITDSVLSEQRLRESLKARQQAEALLLELNADLEMRIAERTRQYDRVWTHSRDLQLVMNGEGVLRAVSPAWTRVLGHQAHDVVGRKLQDFVLPADANWTPQLFAAASIGNDPFGFQNRVRHSNGSVRWIAWHAAVESGVIYAYGRDITAEKIAGAALERSEARLRTIFQTSYQHQAMLDLDGIVVDANSVALASVNMLREDVQGLRFWETAWFAGTPGVPEFVKASVRQCVARGEIQHREIEVVLPDGQRRWFDFTLRPIRDSQDEMVALVYEAVDLTDRRNTEQALRQAQKMEVIGLMAGGIAHDFGNLLQGILLPLKVVQRLCEAGRVQESEHFLRSAIGSAERATVLCRRLLAFSDHKPVESQVLDPNLLIREVMELLRQSLGSGIKLQVTEGSTWQLVADANELENVLLNLCINSRDAMNGNGSIHIETCDISLAGAEATSWNLESGDYVCLRVSDTGQGMSEAVLARAFDPFFTTKPIGQGTGLGLYMVYNFVHKCGGAVRIESALGRGTMVEMLLPRYSASA